MKKLLAFVRKNPSVAIATAAVAGLALGTGVIPLPGLGSIRPAAAPAAAPAAPPPPPDPIDAY